MSENLENQNSEVTETSSVENVDVADEKKSEVSDEKNITDEKTDMEKFYDLAKQIASKRNEIHQELIQRRDYLNKVVPQYDSENYFKNESFKNLYSELFNHIGAKLDMERFIPLLDKYVETRIEANSRKSLAKKENEKVTDGFEFSSGNSKQSEKKLRMQDIPADQLEKYIAKYI